MRARGVRMVVLTGAMALASVVLLAPPAGADACGDMYTPSSGTSGDWSVMANWSTGSLPGPTTTACWPAGDTVTVGTGDTAETAEAITGGALDIDGGTVTVGSSSSDDTSLSSLEIDPGGTLAGPATLAVSGSLTLTGGNIGVDNSPVAPTITSASFSATNSGSIQFYAGSITVDGPATINTKYFDSPETGAASLTDISPANAVTFVQPGAYGADDGRMTITSAGGFAISGGDYTDPANDQLVQTGGTTDIPAGAGLIPGDSVILDGGTLRVDGTLGIGLQINGGTLEGTGTISDTVMNTSGTVTPGDGGPGTLTMPAYIQQSGGTLAIPVDGTAGGQFSVLSLSAATVLAGTLALEPDSAFADSATPGESVDFLPYVQAGGRTGTFTTTTVSTPLQDGESFSADYDDAGDQVDAVVGAAAVQSLVNTGSPVISGTTEQGDTLTTTNGTWSGNPTSFAYQWEDCSSAALSSCTPIGGASSSTYTLTAADVGRYVTVIVTAMNPSATSATAAAVGPVRPLPFVGPPAAPPSVLTRPSVSGTPLPGHRLSCDQGSWTGSPTFSYSWVLGRSPISGATTDTLVVTILDEGQAISCVVSAHNAGGGVTSSSAGVVVAQKGTLHCPQPSGTLTAGRIGPLTLGAGRATERRALKRYAVTHYGFDDFCLYGGWGIRAGYRSARVVLLLTANPFYRVDGITPGVAIAAAARKLKVGTGFVIGLNDWYVAPGHGVNYVFKVRHGVIQEIGIANRALTTGRARQKRFLSGFKAA